MSCSDFFLSIFDEIKSIFFGFLMIPLIIFVNSSGLLGLNKKPLFSLIYSLIPPIFDPITGVPAAIDSIPTNPKGSSLDGKINACLLSFVGNQ